MLDVLQWLDGFASDEEFSDAVGWRRREKEELQAGGSVFQTGTIWNALIEIYKESSRGYQDLFFFHEYVREQWERELLDGVEVLKVSRIRVKKQPFLFTFF